MKAIKIISPLDLQIVDVPIPKISEDKEVLVKVKAAGICDSDFHIYHGTPPVETYPRIIGHEVVGEIIKVG
jgi:L-gulonate 5-dehydrogenase